MRKRRRIRKSKHRRCNDASGLINETEQGSHTQIHQHIRIEQKTLNTADDYNDS